MAASSQSSATGEKEKRYEALLRPIRDLAANWSIDVASDLEEYLEELENIEITFDGGKTSLNFAEAALLIQGSACVYSRKVEYLYALIYQALDILHARVKKGKKRVTDALAAGDADADALEEAEEEFLLLDDAIKEGTRAAITMKERPDELATALNMTMTYAGGPGATPAQKRAAAAVLAKTPLSVMAANRFERRDGGGYRIATLQVGKAGSLLLDAAPLGGRAVSGVASLLDLSLAPIETVNASAINMSTVSGAPQAGGDGVNVLPQDDDVDIGVAYGEGGIDDYGGEDDSFVPEAPVDDAPASTRVTRSKTGTRRSGATTSDAAPKGKPDPWLQLDPFADVGAAAKKPFRKARTYMVLKDPQRVSHEGPLAAAADALQRAAADGGKGSVAARALASRANALSARISGFQASSGASTGSNAAARHADAGAREALTIALTAMASRAHGASTAVPEDTDPAQFQPMTTPAFSEISALYKRQRMVATRARMSLRRAMATAAPVEAAAGAAYDLGHNDEDDDNDGGFGSAFDAAPVSHADARAHDGGAADVDIGVGYGDDQPLPSTTEEEVPARVHPLQFLEDDQVADPFAGDLDDGPRASLANIFAGGSADPDGAAYARAVQKYMSHISSFLKDAGSQVARTAMSKRVGDWQDRLAPILEEEDSRKEFDIHEYGGEILSHMAEEVTPDKAPARPFSLAEILPAPQRFEVCRTFLAMLQLANMGNVEIVPTVAASVGASSGGGMARISSLFMSQDAIGSSQDIGTQSSDAASAAAPFTLKLLSTHMAHEAMNNFIAPSAAASISTTGKVGAGFTGAVEPSTDAAPSAAASARGRAKRPNEVSSEDAARHVGRSRGRARTPVDVIEEGEEEEEDAPLPREDAPLAVPPTLPDVHSPVAKRAKPERALSESANVTLNMGDVEAAPRPKPTVAPRTRTRAARA